MKVLLFAILDHQEETEKLLHQLSSEGYNGTVIPTSGLHHVLPSFNDSQTGAISLSCMVDDLPSGNITLFIVIEEEKVEILKEKIRNATSSFKKIKGGMFVLPLSSVEGTF
ncbi:MAG TPA: hypothetical protein DEF61_02385 [Firmicutes bacterium]|nr:hypothetical protein [Bacillota bacterium]HBX25113.1 hypothetical protein [Bacillota bacterium]